MRLSLVFASLMIVLGATFALTGSLRVGLVAGVIAGLSTALSVAVLTGQWRRASRLRDPAALADELHALEQKFAELQRREELLRAAVDALPAGLCVTATDGAVVAHNRAAPEVLETASLVGLLPRELPLDPQVADAIERAARSQQPVSFTLAHGRWQVLIASLRGGSVAFFTAA